MESSLLSKIQASMEVDSTYNLFTDYLHPFIPYLNSNTSSSSKTTKTLDTTTVRSLAKQFLPFLNKCLSILPKRLSSEAASKTESSTNLPQTSARKLFEIYRLCIGCLELISSQLSCKPYSLQFQWARFIHCLEAWKFFEEAEAEGLLVLERIRGCGSFGAKAGKSNTRLMFLPRLCEENMDRELGLLVVEMVVTVVKCVFMNRSNGTASYKRVLSLVEEAAPWFKILDANECEKLQRMLVSYLDRISLYLFGQSADFGLDLVLKFCEATFSEYEKSSFGDQMYKFASRICSSIFSVVDTQSSSTIHILRCTLSYAAVGCKDLGADESAIEFLELVYYCSNRCYPAAPALCYSVAAELSSLAGSQARPIVGCIMQLYATGLVILSFNNQHNFGKNTKMYSDNTAGSVLFLEKKNVLQEVHVSLEILKDFFNNDGSGGTAYMLSYYNGLKFLCHQLAEHIYAEKKTILGERDCDSLSDNLSISQDACLRLCYLVLQCHSAAGQNNELKNNTSEDIKVIARSAVAAFTISIRTGRYMKESVNLVKRLISDDWVQVNGAKYLFAWLYNIALLLYRDKKVKEASKALSLSCKASWKCLVCFCNSTEPDGDQSSDAFQDFVKEVMQLFTEACGKTAFLLDLLCDGSREKINKIMKESLERWSIAESMWKLLPPPFSLVKHWVKVECKDVKVVNTDESTTTLYTLLSSSTVVSQRALGILLEQELLVYKEARVVDPGYCQKMRILIMDTLLERVYVTGDSLVNKARTLIAKGGEYRALGVERLDDCIHYLSEAIHTLRDNSLGSSSFIIEASHVMAYAFCLRALCLHESVQSNTKMLLLERDFEDIRSAVNLWLRPHQQHSDAQSNLVIDILLSSLHGTDQLTKSSDDILRLLCHVLDLLSTKCYLEVHLDIYDLLIRLFKWKKLPLEDACVIFWQNRRLGHALCASPISEMIISKLSEHYGDIPKSIRFWLDCMKPSKSLLVDFQQSLLSMLTASMERSHFGATHLSDDAKDSDMLVPSDLVCHVSADEFKLGASDLSTCDHDSSISIFHCAYLYYDLSDKSVVKGQIVEALSYAKEAHRMRTKLFQDKFIFSVDQQQTKNFTESANVSRNHCYSLGTFNIRDQAAMEAWGIDVQSDFKGSTLTPWNVLQCYLDSTLQVGLIHEVLGNASEAEALLYWGKSIALRQGLPIYLISFSLALVKLYEKLMVWESAEKELEAASQILGENCNMISCLKCRKLLEVSIHLQRGNLIKNRPCSCPGNTQSEMLSCAGKSYLAAAKNLNISEWEWQISDFGRDGVEQAVYEVQSKTFDCRTKHFHSEAIEAEIGKKEAKVDRRKHRKTKTDHASSSNDLVSGYHLRTTRSMSRSLRNHSKATVNGVQSKHKVNTNDPQPVAMGEDALDNCSLANSVREIRSICTNMKCWHCLGLQVSKSLSLIDLVRMKWELKRKRLLLMLLISIGECLDVGNDNHKAHETILLSTSVLTNPFCPSFSSLSPDSWTDFLEKESMQDLLVVERAMLLYHICRISLKDYSCKFARESSCRLSRIGIARIFSWLKLAFTLSVEVPLLLQKVSRLLAVLYVLSTSIKDFSLPRAEALSESHWASFFHQASIGPYMKQQLFHCLVRERKSRLTDSMVSQTPGSKFIAPEVCSSHRVLHELVKDLDEVAISFFKRLPCSTIIGVSMIGGSDAILLTELLGCDSAQAWFLLSRMHSGGQPVCLLLPVGCILEESSVEMVTSSGESCESKDLVKSWKCPWSCSAVDNVAPIFKVLLKENYLSSSIYPAEDTEQSRLLWWSERKRLDKCIAKFLKDMEDLWLGPWKYLLLGEWADNESLCALEKDIMADLRLKHKVDVDINLLRVIVSSVQFSSEIREQALQLIFSKGCYVGGCCEEILSSSAKCRNLSVDFFNETVETIQGLEIESFVRQPIVLVLDVEIQMLPWESLPIFRNEEVYRMPSIASIFATLDKCSHHEEVVSLRGAAEGFPFIDPLDSFYLLNPSGDLSRTQEEFEDYFKHQNFEGKSGSSPTIEELVAALKSHDLFIYFGHGSGSQYIPGHEIRKLETCAATLLMGCSSGTLSTKGMYAPEGAPLCYLSAGSPVIVANLWEVTDKDIDRFGKAVLDAWLKQRSSLVSADCPECSSSSSSSSSFLLDKLRSLEVSDNTRKNHRTTSKGKKKSKDEKLQDASSSDHDDEVKICVPCCKHRPKVGAFMGQARKACHLPYLIGASPVCYGVPTGIWKKNDL